MECMCAQTRLRFILSSEIVLGNGVRTHVNSKGRISSTGASEEGRTSDAVPRITASQTHYRLSYSRPCRNLKPTPPALKADVLTPAHRDGHRDDEVIGHDSNVTRKYSLPSLVKKTVLQVDHYRQIKRAIGQSKSLAPRHCSPVCRCLT